MKEFICKQACTFSGRLYREGDPLKVTDDTEVPIYFKQVGGASVKTISETKPAKAPEQPKPTLVDVLAELDHSNDDHWNQNGAPSVKAVEKLMGDTSITAADIKEAAPELKRITE